MCRLGYSWTWLHAWGQWVEIDRGTMSRKDVGVVGRYIDMERTCSICNQKEIISVRETIVKHIPE